MTEVDVLDALQKGVIAAVQASSMSTLPIKFIGDVFEVPADQKYIEIVQIPNNTDNYWNDEMTYRGALRLILHWPVGRKVYEPVAVLESVMGYFTKERTLRHGVKIQSNPSFNGPLERGTENLYPATVRYQRFAV